MSLVIILEVFMNNWHIILLFLFIAILYSSVGFGGGSSYLAVLALTTLSFTEIRATALLCNIVVVSSNVFLYQKQKEINWYKILPLIFFSIPLAYLGGFLKISNRTFFILLGFTLLIAAFTMWFSKNYVTNDFSKKNNNLKNSFLGGGIGFISGMVGIGGGIFLAPILHLSKWDTPKKIAATASVFILVNSSAGLLGQVANPDFKINWKLTLLLLITVLIGGQIGSRLSNNYFTPIQLKKTTSILIAFVSIKILYNFLF